MKNIFTFLLIAFYLLGAQAQITLDHSANINSFLVKFQSNGYKYVMINSPVITIYNLNHTVFNTITLPPPYNTIASNSIYYVTDNLFDLDNGIEVAINRPPSTTYTTNFTILNDDGSILFSKDSAFMSGTYGSVNQAYSIQEGVYHDGTGMKMKLLVYQGAFNNYSYLRNDHYNLPGTLPCIDCTSGVVSVIKNNYNGNSVEIPQFFPNPTSGQLKLKYKLPQGSHLAEMKIYDIQGKLVEEFKITDHYDFIYLPTNYNNGLYLYSLIVDGKAVKTEKIVLNK